MIKCALAPPNAKVDWGFSIQNKVKPIRSDSDCLFIKYKGNNYDDNNQHNYYYY